MSTLSSLELRKSVFSMRAPRMDTWSNVLPWNPPPVIRVPFMFVWASRESSK